MDLSEINNTGITKSDLMRAYAGECMSETRYLLAEAEAQKQQLAVIARLFRFTAEQERQHARVLQELMGGMGAGDIDIAASYPVYASCDIQQLLDYAVSGETAESRNVYPDFARIARDEGYSEAAEKFEMIGAVEESHRMRFEHYAELMRSGRLFRSDDTNERWICLNCGHIHTGSEPPQECPLCGVPQGWSIREQEAAFTTGGMLRK